MWYTDGREAMRWRISDLGTHVQPRLRRLVSLQQQAIEDLQSEEEKVNLLTKEKTKLQMQAEDVSIFCICSVCSQNTTYFSEVDHINY